MTKASVKFVLTSKLHLVTLPKGSLYLNEAVEQKSDQLLKDVGINFTVLALSTLHELHQGVGDKVKVCGQ